MGDFLIRFRIHFTKTDSMRFTSHLDLHRTWERSFRRAGLPLAYRQGFNPQARMNLACALPLGFTSQCEILDVWFDSPVRADEVKSKLEPALPPGLKVSRIQEIMLSEPALQTQIESAEYCITLKQPQSDLKDRCEKLLKSPQIMRQWRGKEYDLRPLILDFSTNLADDSKSQIINVRLLAREGATGRPDEIVAALGIPPELTAIERTRLHFLSQFISSDKNPGSSIVLAPTTTDDPLVVKS